MINSKPPLAGHHLECFAQSGGLRRCNCGALHRGPIQWRVARWMNETFEYSIVNDPIERNYRFLEESIELVQSLGCNASDAHALVDYVFGRRTGVPVQEVGGVVVTLAALCNVARIDIEHAGDLEIRRCWENIDKIRARQAEKTIRGGNR